LTWNLNNWKLDRGVSVIAKVNFGSGWNLKEDVRSLIGYWVHVLKLHSNIGSCCTHQGANQEASTTFAHQVDKVASLHRFKVNLLAVAGGVRVQGSHVAGQAAGAQAKCQGCGGQSDCYPTN